MSKKNKKETKTVPLISDKELDEAANEVMNDNVNEEGELLSDETKKVPLIDQLHTHVDFLGTGKKTLIGYSLLFSDEVEEEDESGEKKTIIKHGMATSYPEILNHLLLGFHTNSISNEEVGFMQIISNEIAVRIMNLENVKPVSENEIVENEV